MGITTFLLEVAVGLRGEGVEVFDALLTRNIFDERHEFATVTLIFVGLADVKAGEFAGRFLRVKVESHAGNGRAVDLEEPVIFEVLEDFGARAADEFFVVNGLADEGHDGVNIFFEDAADLLVFVGINHGADAVVTEYLIEEGFVNGSVKDMDARDALDAGTGTVVQL